MAQTYVSLDLETTGLEADRDAVIEICAVKFCGEDTIGTFHTLVAPGRPIPPLISDMTGIRDEDVANAPRLHEKLPELARFVGKSPIIAHSVPFDLAFLRPHGLFPEDENEAIDTFELASILVPGAERYSLQALAGLLKIEGKGGRHRARPDAEATRQLFLILLQRAAALPPRILKEIIGHGQRARWPAAGFFRDALEEASRSPLTQSSAGPTSAPLGPLFATPDGARPLQSAAERTPLDEEQLASLLEEGGALAAHFPGYEHRPQQVAMLRAIARALSRGEHLLVEAPTGVGKSLAYLIPAVHWAEQNGERVVISTNTINLQEQLYHKDLPDLVRILPFEFRAAILKGRSHYLCPAHLQALRRRGANSKDEARVLAKVLVWMLQTTDGDGDQLFLPAPVEQIIWRQLSADHEGCEPERCRRFHEDACYFYRARQAAEAAHLVIVNHALLLADVAVQNRAIPEYRHLIVDEAHHLETATTNGLSFETDRTHLSRLLGEIGRLGQGGKLRGLLAETIGHCQKARLPEETMQRLELSIGKVGMAVERAAEQLEAFFKRLEEFAHEQDMVQQGQYASRMRITSGLRVQPAWESVEIAWDDACAPLAAAADGLRRLADGLEAAGTLEVEELQAQMVGAARRLEETRKQVSQMISEPSPSLIHWLELDPGQKDHLRLHAAPLHIGPLVEEHLFHKKESVVLTSATLRAGGTFDFLRERLNAWDAEELAVGSPFDYRNSTLVYLIDDIPEPGKPGHQKAVEEGMVALFRATEGRALALFTSYSQMRSTLQAIRAPLDQSRITVQAQGEGSSRSQLLEDFRTGNRRVLLGTRSFWEGVDVPGEALSCLAIAKLPFSVPDDPIFAARAETFEQPFLEYSVPETILRFLQGFGRLIRTRTDRGVVAIFDTRLLTKSYGELFIRSLPGPTVQQGSIALLPEAAAEWLSAR